MFSSLRSIQRLKVDILELEHENEVGGIKLTNANYELLNNVFATDVETNCNMQYVMHLLNDSYEPLDSANRVRCNIEALFIDTEQLLEKFNEYTPSTEVLQRIDDASSFSNHFDVAVRRGTDGSINTGSITSFAAKNIIRLDWDDLMTLEADAPVAHHNGMLAAVHELGTVVFACNAEWHYLTTSAQVDTKIFDATNTFISANEIDGRIYEATKTFISADEIGVRTDFAIKDFISGDEVNLRIDIGTSNFLSADTIDERIAVATSSFISGDIVNSRITTALTDYIIGDEVNSRIGIATSNFLSADTIDERIAVATSTFISGDIIDFRIDVATSDFISGDEVNRRINTTTQDFISESAIINHISIATSNFMSADDIFARILSDIGIETKDFITKDETINRIDVATSNFLSDVEIDRRIGVATSNFISGDEIDTRISSATSTFISETEIQYQIGAATSNFVPREEIDSKIATVTSNFTSATSILTSTLMSQSQVQQLIVDLQLVNETKLGNDIYAATSTFISEAAINDKISTATTTFVSSDNINDRIATSATATLATTDSKITAAVSTVSVAIGSSIDTKITNKFSETLFVGKTAVIWGEGDYSSNVDVSIHNWLSNMSVIVNVSVESAGAPCIANIKSITAEAITVAVQTYDVAVPPYPTPSLHYAVYKT